MSERTSNKQLLTAIEAIPAAIAAAIAATQVATPVAIATPDTAEQQADTVKVDAAYKQHMVAKVQSFADSKGESTVLYARKNGHGEVKLAYCLASKFAGLKDRGLIGAVEVVDPS